MPFKKRPRSEDFHEPRAERNPPQQAALVAGLRLRVFAGRKVKPEAHTLLFALSVLAIVPLAALLNHATDSEAAKALLSKLRPWHCLSTLSTTVVIGVKSSSAATAAF